jgi:phosphoglycolate phosphatase
VLDFDGFLVNSYAVVRDTLAHFGLDVGDEERFRNRRKFLKYLGGGREILKNLVLASLPRKRNIRRALTQTYLDSARLYPGFAELINDAIAHPAIHCGVLSRNFACDPGPTIRRVLASSGVLEPELDFVLPIPAGSRKTDILQAMRASRYDRLILGADEVGDYHAAVEAGYDCVIATYGFDNRQRLLTHGAVPESVLCDDPAQVIATLRAQLGLGLGPAYARRSA